MDLNDFLTSMAEPVAALEEETPPVEDPVQAQGGYAKASTASDQKQAPSCVSGLQAVEASLQQVLQAVQAADATQAVEQQTLQAQFQHEYDVLSEALQSDQSALATLNAEKAAKRAEATRLLTLLEAATQQHQDVSTNLHTVTQKLKSLQTKKARREAKKTLHFPFFAKVKTDGKRSFGKVPGTALETIFSYLSLQEMERCSMVCQAWLRAITRSTVWRYGSNQGLDVLRQITLAKSKKLSPEELFEMSLKPKKNQHWHYLLTIAVPQPDDYLITVAAQESKQVTCSENKNKPNVTTNKERRSITIEVCEHATMKNLQMELKFCVSTIRQHSMLTNYKLDFARLQSLQDESAGMKELLQSEIADTKQQSVALEEKLHYIRQQTQSDEITGKFLNEELLEINEKLSVAQARTRTLLAGKDEELALKRQALSDLENERKTRESELTQLRKLRVMLTTEAKQTRSEVAAASERHDEMKTYYERLTTSLRALQT